MQTPDGFVREGDEEVTYIVVDLPPTAMPVPGAQALIEGLDTAAPRLQLADGSWVVGHYESTIGSTLVLTDETQQVADDQSGTVRYLCHTERRLVFRK